MNKIKALATYTVIAILAGGCVSTEMQSRPQASPAEFTAQSRYEAVFRPGILFSVAVQVDGTLEIESDPLRLSDSGSALLPILGQVELGGMTLDAATAQLTDRYRRYYKSEPTVRLQFLEDESGKSAPWGYVTVLGRVRKPGRVNLPPTQDMTVSGAIQEADGFDTSANLKAVRIMREAPDGSVQHLEIDMIRIGKAGALDQDIRLNAGDVIYVPEEIL